MFPKLSYTCVTTSLSHHGGTVHSFWIIRISSTNSLTTLIGLLPTQLSTRTVTIPNTGITFVSPRAADDDHDIEIPQAYRDLQTAQFGMIIGVTVASVVLLIMMIVMCRNHNRLIF